MELISKSEAPPLTFIKWLRAQADRNDPVGDLAGDFKRDRRARGVQSIQKLRDSMVSWYACREAFEALDEAIEEWRGDVLIREATTCAN